MLAELVSMGPNKIITKIKKTKLRTENTDISITPSCIEHHVHNKSYAGQEDNQQKQIKDSSQSFQALIHFKVFDNIILIYNAVQLYSP